MWRELWDCFVVASRAARRIWRALLVCIAHAFRTRRPSPAIEAKDAKTDIIIVEVKRETHRFNSRIEELVHEFVKEVRGQ